MIITREFGKRLATYPTFTNYRSHPHTHPVVFIMCDTSARDSTPHQPRLKQTNAGTKRKKANTVTTTETNTVTKRKKTNKSTRERDLVHETIHLHQPTPTQSKKSVSEVAHTRERCTNVQFNFDATSRFVVRARNGEMRMFYSKNGVCVQEHLP